MTDEFDKSSFPVKVISVVAVSAAVVFITFGLAAAVSVWAHLAWRVALWGWRIT